jgi:hypothetical protein
MSEWMREWVWVWERWSVFLCIDKFTFFTSPRKRMLMPASCKAKTRRAGVRYFNLSLLASEYFCFNTLTKSGITRVFKLFVHYIYQTQIHNSKVSVNLSSFDSVKVPNDSHYIGSLSFLLYHKRYINKTIFETEKFYEKWVSYNLYALTKNNCKVIQKESELQRNVVFQRVRGVAEFGRDQHFLNS